jgi:DNA primase large subunit
MQQTFSKFAKSDYAKYPFLKTATRYMRIPELRIQDLIDPAFESILKRAEERLNESILYAIVSYNSQMDEDVEIISFPVAIMLALATKDSLIKKRYALAEANKAYEDLKDEPKDRILEFAKNFGWKLAAHDSTLSQPYEFSICFTDYLRNTTYLRDKKWKLVNRILSKGNVCLGKEETTRLLKEEVRKHIEERLDTKDLPTFQPEIAEIAEKIKNLSLERTRKVEVEEFPSIITQEAFPPCINALYQAFTSGRHLSHIGRFTLTSFLISIGMPPEKVVELFKSISDFNERMTRYQVEHIAGERGSRARYIPPKCDTLRTHGVCLNPDETCKRIRHPLAYYRVQYRKGLHPG